MNRFDESELRNCPNIVEFAGFTDNPCTISFKLYDTSLESFIEESNASPMTYIGILKDVACGMCDVHSKEIVHYDLKPGNQAKLSSLKPMF